MLLLMEYQFEPMANYILLKSATQGISHFTLEMPAHSSRCLKAKYLGGKVFHIGGGIVFVFCVSAAIMGNLFDRFVFFFLSNS